MTRAHGWLVAAALGISSPALAVDPPQVSGASLAKDAESWADRTLEIQDHFGGLAQEVPEGERSLGFSRDSHLRFILVDARVAAFLPRTEQNEKLLKGMGRNDRITVTGVLRREIYRKPDKDRIVGDLDITTHYAKTRVQVFDLRSMKKGWANDPPFLKDPPDGKDYVAAPVNALEHDLAASEGKRLKVEVPAGALAFSRSLDAGDAALGFSMADTVRFRWSAGGPYAYAERNLANLNTLTSVEPSEKLELWVRILKAGSDVRVVVDRMAVVPPRP